MRKLRCALGVSIACRTNPNSVLPFDRERLRPDATRPCTESVDITIALCAANQLSLWYLWTMKSSNFACGDSGKRRGSTNLECTCLGLHFNLVHEGPVERYDARSQSEPPVRRSDLRLGFDSPGLARSEWLCAVGRLKSGGPGIQPGPRKRISTQSPDWGSTREGKCGQRQYRYKRHSESGNRYRASPHWFRYTTHPSG